MAQNTAQKEQPKVDQNDPVPVEPSNQVQVYFLCSRFVPAQTLRKRLEAQKELCQIHAADDPDSILHAASTENALIVYHITSALEVQSLAKFIGQLSEPLSSSRLAIVVISRTHVQQLKSFLSRYPKAFVLPTTVLLADLEKQVQDIIRAKVDAPVALGQSQDSDDIVLSNGTAAEKSTFVLKGLAAKKHSATEDRKAEEMLAATQSQPQLKWGANEWGKDKVQQDDVGLSARAAAAAEKAIADQARVTSASAATEAASKMSPAAARPERQKKSPLSPVAAATDAKFARPSIFQNKLFGSVKTPLERTTLLKDCVDSKAPVIMAQLDCEVKIAGRFYSVDKDGKKMRCQLKSSPEVLRDFRETHVDGQPLIFSASLRQSRLFMASAEVKWLETSPSLIELAVPEEMFVVQRRDSFRLVLFPDATNLASAWLSASARKQIEMPLYDVSQGGVGLLATADEARWFKRGDIITGLTFQLEDVVVHCERLITCHVTPMPIGNSAPLFRVGFKFEKLKPQLHSQLGEFIERNSMAYFTSYLVGKKP